jgi:putative hydrolase of the HAD superfamily
MRAIVFDFFGTLTDPAAERLRAASFAGAAAVLRVTPGAFAATMAETFTERATGKLGDTRSTLHEIARRCGSDPTATQLDLAVTAQRAAAAPLRRPRPGVMRLLTKLRDTGFKLAVLSDCSSELVEAWPSTPWAEAFDTAVFSWQEGRRKPDPALYETAAARLELSTTDCWYVGASSNQTPEAGAPGDDDSHRELRGAAETGMRTVLLTAGTHPQTSDDPGRWTPDTTITDLSDLLTLVGMPEMITTSNPRPAPLR